MIPPKISGAFVVVSTLHACITVALVITVAISTLGKPDSKRATQTATYNNRDAQQATLAVQNKNDAVENDSGPSNETSEEYGNLSQTIAAMVQAFAALVSLGLTIWLIVYSHRGWEAADKNAAAARRSARVSKRTLRTLRAIERAYVSISHVPPGVVFAPHTIDRVTHGGERVLERHAAVRLAVTNLGNTPALVTGWVFHELLANAQFGLHGPAAYNMDRFENVRIHVPKSDPFNITCRFTLNELSYQSITNGTVLLCIVGFVDYIDRFGGRQRVGYARAFDPGIECKDSLLYWSDAGGFDGRAYQGRNNLPIVTQLGYNYDRERHEGEGNDWSEPPQ